MIPVLLDILRDPPPPKFVKYSQSLFDAKHYRSMSSIGGVGARVTTPHELGVRGRAAFFFRAPVERDLGLGLGWDKCMLLRLYSFVVTPLASIARCCSFNTIATLATRSISSPSLTSAATAATRLRLYTSAATRTRVRSRPTNSTQQLYPDRVYASPAPEATTPYAASASAAELVNMVKPIQGTQYALDAQFKKISRDFRT